MGLGSAGRVCAAVAPAGWMVAQTLARLTRTRAHLLMWLALMWLARLSADWHACGPAMTGGVWGGVMVVEGAWGPGRRRSRS